MRMANAKATFEELVHMIERGELCLARYISVGSKSRIELGAVKEL